MDHGVTRAAANKKIREEALRDKLVAMGLVQHVVELAEKLADLDISLDANTVTRLKASGDLKLKLIAKYLPDLKSVDAEVNHSGQFFIAIHDAPMPDEN